MSASSIPIEATESVTGRLPQLSVAVAWPLLFATLALVPLFTSELTTYRVGLVLIQGITVIGLHVLVNWSRQISLGHAALVAVPAFTAARMAGGSDLPLVAVLPAAMLVGAAMGAIVGVAALRVRGLQVAIVTLLFGVAIDRYALALPWFQQATLAEAPAIQLGPWPLFTNRALFPLLLFLFGSVLVLTRALESSKVARALKMLGSSEGLAQAAGVPTGQYAFFAYAYAGVLAGIAGAMQMYWVTRVGSASFGFTASLLLLTIVVVGGPGSFAGPLVATAMFVSRDLPAWMPAVALVVVVVAAPGGINALGRSTLARWHRHRTREGPPA